MTAAISRRGRGVGRISARRALATLFAVILLGTLAHGTALSRPGGAPPKATIDPALDALMARVDPAQQLAIIVTLRERVAVGDGPGAGRPGNGGAVTRALRQTADRSQPAVLAAIAGHVAAGRASGVRPLWITNAVALRAQSDVIEQLTSLPQVATIEPDRTVLGPEPLAVQAGGVVEPNIVAVGAPTLWADGLDGTGAVIASMDTGVDATHPDLVGRYRGGTNAWYDPYGQHPAGPTDVSGHGTQTLGVAVGGSAGGSAIGVAPAAQWIGVKAFADNGLATTSGLHLAFQWLLDPDGNPATTDEPDVVSASWSSGAPGCDLTFEPDLAALVAAGIVPVVAAGNTGPGAATATSPANNPSAFAVGAVDATGTVASFSARGPSACGSADATTFPRVVAPGVSVRTTERFGLYTTATGTSLAVPHVAGAVALLRQAFPNATVGQLEAAMVAAAADLGPPGPDDAYGGGRLDIAAARTSLAGGGNPPPGPSPTPTPTPTPSPGPRVPPVVGPVAVAPNPASGTSNVALSAVVDATSGDTVVAAEWFVDTVGAAGTGRPLSAAWGTQRVTVSGTVTGPEIAGLTEGVHHLYLRARGALSGWGSETDAALVVDRTPPALGNAAVTPASSLGAASVSVAIDAIDAAGPIVRGEWFRGADPGIGRGSPLTAADGSFNQPAERLSGSVSTAGLAFGDHVIRVRAVDAAGNWSAATGIPILVTPADAIFADGFEAGTTGRWSAATGGSRLAVDSSAALSGDRGLVVSFGSQPAYVVDTSPVAATSYRARVRVDTSTVSTGSKVVDIVAARSGAGDVVASIQFRRGASGSGEVRLFFAKRKGSTTSDWFAIGAGSHALELSWTSATSASTALFVDGTSRAVVGSADTSPYRVEEVRLGQTASLGGASGRLLMDGFVSTRGTAIGP